MFKSWHELFIKSLEEDSDMVGTMFMCIFITIIGNSFAINEYQYFNWSWDNLPWIFYLILVLPSTLFVIWGPINSLLYGILNFIIYPITKFILVPEAKFKAKDKEL